MIGGIRKFAKSKWAAVLLFIPLIISFGIFGFQDPFRGITGGGFIRIGDREIRPADITKELQDMIDEARVRDGKVLSQNEAMKQGLGQQALSKLMYQTALSAYADLKGIRASTDAVQNTLLNDTTVFKDALGRVNIEAIRAEASQRGLRNVKQYEDFVRDAMTRFYIQDSSMAALKVPDLLSLPVINFEGESRTLTVAKVGEQTVTGLKAPTDAELETWYNGHKEMFAQKERRRISVLSYSPDDFLDRTPVTDEQVKAEYEARIKDYSTPETRTISEFSSTDRNAVQSLVDLVKQGVTVDEAQKRVAGLTRTDRTVKPADVTNKDYNQLVFSLPANQIHSNPFKLDDASPWTTLIVNTITPGIAEPFEKVADKVRHDLAMPEAQRVYEDESEKFRDAAGGQPLEDIGKQFGFPVTMLAPIDQQGRTITGEPVQIPAGAPALQELFTLQPGQMTNLFEGDNVRSMYRLDEIIAPYTQPFAEVKPRVQLLYVNEQKRNAASKAADDMVAAVKGGKTFEQAAAAAKLTVLPVLTTTRFQGEQGSMEPGLLQGSFALKQGDVSVVMGGDGVPWVVRVEKIEPVTPAVAAMLRAQIAPRVAQTLQQDLQQVFVGGLQKEVKFDIQEAAVQQYFDSFTKDEQ
ncbi:MAG: peptidyl-prolyl cis-trans isomerase [Hyphomonadaceae bacterium]